MLPCSLSFQASASRGDEDLPNPAPQAPAHPGGSAQGLPLGRPLPLVPQSVSPPSELCPLRAVSPPFPPPHPASHGREASADWEPPEGSPQGPPRRWPRDTPLGGPGSLCGWTEGILEQRPVADLRRGDKAWAQAGLQGEHPRRAWGTAGQAGKGLQEQFCARSLSWGPRSPGDLRQDIGRRTLRRCPRAKMKDVDAGQRPCSLEKC